MVVYRGQRVGRVDGERGGVHARTVDERVAVVGAGPAGLAAPWAIGRAGLIRSWLTRRTLGSGPLAGPP